MEVEVGGISARGNSRDYEGREVMAWNDTPTEKQLKYLEELREMSEYPIPKFTGTTRKDVQEYIDKYRPIAYQRTDKFGFY